jgi:cysteine-rich repeat protein
LDKGEQCDEGQFNGISPNCDRWCHAQFCGNSIVEKMNLEECEPLKLDDGSYELPMCGKSCTVPLCDLKGSCIGGCRWVFLPACKVTDLNSGASASSVSSERMRSSAWSSAPFVSRYASSSSAGVQSFILPSPIVFNEEFASSQSFTGTSDVAGTCGNATTEEGEECDDGSDNSDALADGCRTNCTHARCGDVVLDQTEECDRGDSENILGNGCTPTCKMSRCGNNMLEPGEECDDGPRNSDTTPDSCSTLCLLPHCGDSLVDPSFGEVCDNGLNNSGTKPDACRMNCVPAHCGDAVKDDGEQCDNGSANSDTRANACRVSCKLASCGDRVIDAGEQCDAGPGGSQSCTVKCTEALLRSAAPAEPASEADNAIPLFVFVVMLAGILVWRLHWMIHL